MYVFIYVEIFIYYNKREELVVLILKWVYVILSGYYFDVGYNKFVRLGRCIFKLRINFVRVLRDTFIVSLNSIFCIAGRFEFFRCFFFFRVMFFYCKLVVAFIFSLFEYGILVRN